MAGGQLQLGTDLLERMIHLGLSPSKPEFLEAELAPAARGGLNCSTGAWGGRRTTIFGERMMGPHNEFDFERMAMYVGKLMKRFCLWLGIVLALAGYSLAQQDAGAQQDSMRSRTRLRGQGHRRLTVWRPSPAVVRCPRAAFRTAAAADRCTSNRTQRLRGFNCRS